MTARRRAVWAVLAAPPAVFLALFFVWPTLTLLLRGLTGDGLVGDDSSSASDGLAGVLGDGRTWAALGSSVGLAAAGTAVALGLGLPAAWALFRVRWRGQGVVRALVSVPFVLPTVVVAVAFGALLRPSGPLGLLGADQGVAPIVAALAFFNVSVVVRVVGGAWAGLDPATAVAARTLGASPWQALRHVTAPALAPAIAAAAATVFLFCSTSFAIVLVLGGTRVSTLETEIWLNVQQFLDLRTAAVLALLQVAVVAVTLWLAGWARARQERSLRRSRVDGSRPATPGDVRWVVLALLPTALLVLPPGIALVERSLRTTEGWSLDHYRTLVSSEPLPGMAAPLSTAAVNSLGAALIAGTVALLLGLTVSTLAARGRAGRALDALAMAPLGVSSVVVGLGMLVILARPTLGLGLSGAAVLIPVAQAVVALPLVVRSLVPVMRAIDPRLRAAAATLGASPGRVWRQVDWPLVRRPAGLALGLAFAVAVGEFGATAFLARPEHPTLPTAIVRLLGRPGLESAGAAFAAAVALAALTGLVMLVAERLRGRGVAHL